ncbi:MAG TPA: tryptophan 2,3-dioxygenase family protein [Acidimicrobiales bacterium]|nr:tryptophan 2,3-dioxygenase family protein [Acidimicrobiales bacterium]
MTPDHDPALTYSRYLALDEVLSAQRPLSDEHDELLFIVVHQVYELWFKQLLHELAHLRARLQGGDTAHALHTLKRVLTILKVVVAQIDVLETMTPRQFTGFRARLESSSGFQSVQFRQLEAMVGPPLFGAFLTYLAGQGYRHDGDGDGAVEEAILAAYRDDGEPAQVAERLVDLDEGLQEWRYRHVKMVERTIGDKPGTGGSTGVDYLRRTLFRPAFPHLWAVRSRL